VLFAFVVVAIVVNAAPVLKDPGIGALLGGQFRDPKGNLTTGYSIFPALWGTVLTTLIAAAVALPVSLVMAIVAVDFPMGPIGRVIRPIVGILSGIPPIVYAVSVPGFVVAFMIPKFAGNLDFSGFQNGGAAAIGANPATWPPSDVPYSPGGFPWDLAGPNSVLLGGVLVGLFLIPFLAPIFVDALANVPRLAREGSLALGANYTYTLRRVVLPRALPAIASGATFGVLKAMGDSVIVIFAIGYAATMPNPPFDVLERAAPVGAWASGLLGSFDVLGATCLPQACAVGYTSTLSLLLVAAVVVVTMTYLRGRGRRRASV
jgi:phosphate transport system permease protein